MEEPTEIPATALRFSAPAVIGAAESEGKRQRTVGGVAYSGDLLTGHWYWGAVIFDLAGIEPPQARVPLLVEHDRSQRIGHTSLDIGADALRLADAVLMDTPVANNIAAEADQGFPWQMSVHIEPTRTEELQPGITATVNGREIRGPATIFRASRIREVSLTPTGVDPNTPAKVFAATARGDTVMSNETKPEAKLSADIASLEQQLAAATKRAEEAEAKVAAIQLSVRTEQVKGLFAKMGREFSEEAAKPYLAMPEEAFSLLAADLAKFSAPTPPPHLFSPQVPAGTQPGAPSLDPTTIYAARRQQKE